MQQVFAKFSIRCRATEMTKLLALIPEHQAKCRVLAYGASLHARLRRLLLKYKRKIKGIKTDRMA